MNQALSEKAHNVQLFMCVPVTPAYSNTAPSCTICGEPPNQCQKFDEKYRALAMSLFILQTQLSCKQSSSKVLHEIRFPFLILCCLSRYDYVPKMIQFGLALVFFHVGARFPTFLGPYGQ